jgi:hypothetical protein
LAFSEKKMTQWPEIKAEKLDSQIRWGLSQSGKIRKRKLGEGGKEKAPAVIFSLLRFG